MVEFTYQDYLKYEKLLEKQKRREKEQEKRKDFTEKEIEKFANILIKLEKLIDEDYNYQEEQKEETNELMVMEEDTKYIIERQSQTRRKQKKT